MIEIGEVIQIETKKELGIVGVMHFGTRYVQPTGCGENDWFIYRSIIYYMFTCM